jgi:hypothetical protein
MIRRFFAILSFLAVFFPGFLYAETMTVITKENAVREYCKFFAPVKAQVKYNDTLEVLSPQGDWFKVKFRGTAGCIHKTALQKKAVSTGGSLFSGRKPGVSESEAALAGKGFNVQVESSYKRKHPEMRYNLVDYVERLDATVPDNYYTQFISGGGLRQP